MLSVRWVKKNCVKGSSRSIFLLLILSSRKCWRFIRCELRSASGSLEYNSRFWRARCYATERRDVQTVLQIVTPPQRESEEWSRSTRMSVWFDYRGGIALPGSSKGWAWFLTFRTKPFVVLIRTTQFSIPCQSCGMLLSGGFSSANCESWVEGSSERRVSWQKGIHNILLCPAKPYWSPGYQVVTAS